MRNTMMGFSATASLVAVLALLSGPALAQPNASGASSQTPGLVPQAINPDEPTYCRADGVAYCSKEQGSRACLMRNLDKVSKPCRTALTLTPTTGGPGGFGRPIDAQ
jgi:hypothetical protein